MPVTFADKPCYDAATLYEECRRIGYPTDWATKANRFDDRAGHLPGTGYLLMRRGDLDAIDLSKSDHDLTFIDGDNKPVVIKWIHVAGNTTCLTPGIPEDENSIHLVPIADDRRMWQLTSINAGYNLRLTPNGKYVYATAADADTPFTRREIWTDLWGRLPEEYASLKPDLPLVAPYVSLSYLDGANGLLDNLAYWGMTVAEAIGHFLARCGYALVRNPTTDKWSVVGIGTEQSGLEVSESVLMGRRLWDIEPVQNRLGVVPASVQVYFRKSMGPRAYGQSPYLSYEVDAPVPLEDGETGTVIIHDDMMAEFAGGSLLNGTAISARAAIRAQEFFRVRRDWFADPARKVYSGAIDKIFTGSEIEGVSWIDAGHGVMTETRKTPVRDPLESWSGNKHQPWRLVEYVRTNVETVEPVETPPTGYQSGQVQVFNTDTDLWEEISMCWWRGANRETGQADWRYKSRYMGHKQGRPVYLGFCCQGGEGPIPDPIPPKPDPGDWECEEPDPADCDPPPPPVDVVIPNPPGAPPCGYATIYATLSNQVGCAALTPQSIPMPYNVFTGLYDSGPYILTQLSNSTIRITADLRQGIAFGCAGGTTMSMRVVGYWSCQLTPPAPVVICCSSAACCIPAGPQGIVSNNGTCNCVGPSILQATFSL